MTVLAFSEHSLWATCSIASDEMTAAARLKSLKHRTESCFEARQTFAFAFLSAVLHDMVETKRSKDKSEREHKHKRKHKSDREGSSKKARKGNVDHIHIVDETGDDDIWEEKNIDMDGEKVSRVCPTPTANR